MVTDQYNDEVTGDEQARSIAQEIETQFDKKVNRNFRGWKTNPETHNEMRDAIISALIETDSLALYEDNQFVDNCVSILLRIIPEPDVV